MSADFMQQPFPRALLLGAAGLVALTILGAALRPGGLPETNVRSGSLESSTALRFSDRSDGAILVHDDATGRELTTIPPGSGGFVRAALRALSRDRKLSNARPDAPFVLERAANGRLRLIDTTNERVVELAAFGPTNSGAFAALLSPDGRAR